MREKQDHKQQNLIKLKREWAYYIVICIFLTIMNVIMNPHSLWVLWCIGGWGLSLVLKTINYKFSNKE